MLDLHDVWLWMSSLKTSIPFAIALAILVATVLATIADWVEDTLVGHQASQAHADDVTVPIWEPQSRTLLGSQSLSLVDDIRNRENA